MSEWGRAPPEAAAGLVGGAPNAGAALSLEPIYADLSAAMGFVPQPQHLQQPSHQQQAVIAAAAAAAQHAQLQQHHAALPHQHRGPLPPVSCARKEEVQKLLGQALIIKCDPELPILVRIWELLRGPVEQRPVLLASPLPCRSPTTIRHTSPPPPAHPQAPVIVSPVAQDSNPYHLLARHLRTDVLSGAERFWKL